MIPRFDNLDCGSALRFSLAFCLTAMMATAANAAAISLVNTTSDFKDGDGQYTETFNTGAGANALVVVAMQRQPSPTIDVTLDGSAADWTTGFQGSQGDRSAVQTYLFWVDPNTDYDIEVNMNNGRNGFAAYSLSNVYGVLGFDSFGFNGNGDTTETLTYDGTTGGYAITGMVAEGPGSATPEITGDNIDSTVLNADIGVDYGAGVFWASLESTGGQIATAGSYSNSYTGYKAIAGNVVSFQVIPEPSAALLLTVGGLAMAGLRRRS